MSETNEMQQLPFEALYLSDFKKYNPQCTFTSDNNQFTIEKPYGSEDVRFVFNKSDIALIKDLNNIVFLPQFDAIVHIDRNEMEFIYAYIKPNEPRYSIINRTFDFHFKGSKFICNFREPSTRLFELAKRYRSLTGNVVPQMKVFRDAQRLDKLPEKARKYFTERVPVNFYIQSDIPLLSFELDDLARNLNFYMLYYDRISPYIVIRQPDARTARIQPRRFLSDKFPLALSAHPVDDFILQLMEVARSSSPRFAFIYFYQVLEYAGYYFIDEKAKKEIRQFLRDPALIMCPEEKVAELFTILSELQRNDESRMRKVIEDFCNPEDIWDEIENDKDFFASPLECDGGFTLPPLISKDTTLATWKTMWMPKLFDYLTKVRNCLVHARERRESKVILPTIGNTYKIERYITVILRLAEQIALSKLD